MEKEEKSTQIKIFMRDNLSKEKDMEKVFIFIEMEMLILDTLKTIIFVVKEFINARMETLLRANGIYLEKIMLV